MSKHNKERTRDVMIFLTQQLDKLEKEISCIRKQKDIYLEQIWEEREEELNIKRDFIEQLIDEAME